MNDDCVKIEFKDFIYEQDLDELEFKHGVKSNLPEPEDLNVTKKVKVYDAEVSCNVLFETEVQAEDGIEGEKIAHNKISMENFDDAVIQSFTNTNMTQKSEKLIDKRTDKEFNMKRYVWEKEEWDKFKLEPWKKALLSSNNQTSLKEFVEGEMCE